MSFFQGASNVTIDHSTFNNVTGTMMMVGHRLYQANFDSNNTYNMKQTDSFNNNSKTFNGQNSSSSHSESADDETDYMPSSLADDRGENDHTGPPPQPRVVPQQKSPAAGRVSNPNSSNAKDDQSTDSSKSHIETRQDRSRATPPINQRRRVGPQRKAISDPDEDEENEDVQSNGRSPGNLKAPVQTPTQAKLPQDIRTCVPSVIDSSNLNINQPFLKAKRFFKNLIPKLSKKEIGMAHLER